MGTNLFVGGIPYSSTEDGLKAAFEQAGAVVSVKIIIDRATNRSKGFGFVEMADADGAAKAIEMWNGQEYDGRRLVVNEARPQEERPRREFNNDGGDW